MIARHQVSSGKPVCIHRESATTPFVFFTKERHCGKRQTAKVIIIRGHAAPHLTDGDNLSQHFSIKKENTNKPRGRESTHRDVHTSWEKTDMTLRTRYLIKSDAPSPKKPG